MPSEGFAVKVVIVVQARMGSTRLPGKVLKVIGDRPMLSYQLERLRRVQSADQIVIATTTNRQDDVICSFCDDEKVSFVRGSEADVLSRYREAARHAAAELVVRVTADCPLIDPSLIDLAVHRFKKIRPDYLSNMLEPSWPYGMAVEVFPMSVLEQANREATEGAEREHVTPFIYWRPTRYRLFSLTRTPKLDHHRWTVDTMEDFLLVSRIINSVYTEHPYFTLDDVLRVLDRNPEWPLINSAVRQFNVGLGRNRNR